MLTLDSSKSVLIYRTLQPLNADEMMRLRKYAIQMEPMRDISLDWHPMRKREEITFHSEFLRKTEEAGIIYQVSRSIKEFRIKPLYHLSLLIDIAENPQKTETEIIEDGYEDPDIEDFINGFTAFIRSGELWKYDSDWMENTLLADLIAQLPYFESLLPLYQQLPAQAKLTIHTRYLSDRILNLRPVNRQWERKHLSPSLINESEKLQLSGTDLFLDLLAEVAIDIKNLPAPANPILAGSLGMQAHQQGDYTRAIALFEEMIRQTNRIDEWKRSFLPDNPLFSFLYCSALLSEKSAKSLNKVKALLKKKELKEENIHFPAYLLLSVADESAFTPDINRTAVYRVDSHLGALLYALVCKNYELETQQVFFLDEALFLIRTDAFRYLWKQAARYYPELQQSDTETDTAAVAPILPAYQKQKPWEQILNKLLGETAASAPGNRDTEVASASRIIYLINRYGEITPMLQKSKDGVTWKGGRKIALRTFAYGMEEMTESDRLVAATLHKYPSRMSGNYEYQLRGDETLLALAGNPNVYLYSNPDLPVEISRVSPYISLTKTAQSFRIETNAESPMHLSRIQVCPEHETKIGVMEFTPKQIRIFEQLFRFDEYPLEAEPLLRKLLGQISADITIHSDLIAEDAESRILIQDADATPVVQILPLGEYFKAELFVKPLGESAPYCKPAIGHRNVMGHAGQQTTQVIRNFQLEKHNAGIVRNIFRDFDPDADDILTLESIADCLELLDELYQQEDSVRIEWPEEEKIKIRNRASSSGFSISVKGENTWFNISGSLKISKNEEIKIIDLMKQVRESDSRFIRLEGNSYLALTRDLRRQLLELNSLTTVSGNSLQLSSFAAPLIEWLEKGGIDVTKDNRYTQLIDQISKSSAKEVSLPSGLEADLRDYQQEGFRWASRLADWGAGACLADDMGLGKTLQAISVLLSRARKGASLVVVPASVSVNWENEIRRFAPALNVLSLNTPGCRRKETIERAQPYDVILTTYGLLISEQENLIAQQWNMVVLDEAHLIKNKETKMSKVAMELKADFRMILTGTPLQNHLSEIWNLFEFINPGLLGTFRHFTERFIMPIELRQDKKQQQVLKRILSPFILRRTKNEVLHELPGKTEILQLVELSPEELQEYEMMRRKAEMSLRNKDLNAVKTLAEITRLRQAACHPALVVPGYEGRSSKTDAFIGLVDELIENKHRALVFSQFTSHLALIRKELERAGIDYLYLDGSTPVQQRSKLVKEFQTGEQPLFLISLKAGGLGLNLTAADYIIHLDPWWNPAVEEQASDRAYRIGQTRPVTVYRLIAQHTIEEKIIQLHHTKRDLADSLLEGSNISAKLTREEMLDLIRKT